MMAMPAPCTPQAAKLVTNWKKNWALPMTYYNIMIIESKTKLKNQFGLS
jgi:hypothetical protein